MVDVTDTTCLFSTTPRDRWHTTEILDCWNKKLAPLSGDMSSLSRFTERKIKLTVAPSDRRDVLHSTSSWSLGWCRFGDKTPQLCDQQSMQVRCPTRQQTPTLELADQRVTWSSVTRPPDSGTSGHQRPTHNVGQARHHYTWGKTPVELSSI
ncbi:hypothetical protein CONLIGDRAFT_479916 [Coniochaeta ligniaria NRRL 30616]|uniref:Uncharacterized protein n=1 Tax=Coniochaeta ligniaria NRRL 30616 TaxID=1408157 RepID=A0A1J7IGN0_9PEZI|nr:hypothetical protein CONLIGDRAFT_479916 [Coniochaeta ligniaria NRRL 30616]